MQVTGLALILAYLISIGQCQMEPYIVDGHDADIKDFAYIAYLNIKCTLYDGPVYSYVCGSSIITQELTLTAAHCTDECTGETSINIYVGHEKRFFGASSSAHSFLQHKFFNERNLRNDICLIRLNAELEFSSIVQRVALMANPPDDGEAVVAGWGIYDPDGTRYSDTLRFAKQYVKDTKYCRDRGGQPGTICATHMDGYVAQGDSGTPLMARGYIQIGIVSYTYQKQSVQGRLDFYTDTAFHYEWIEENTQRLCAVE